MFSYYYYFLKCDGLHYSLLVTPNTAPEYHNFKEVFSKAKEASLPYWPYVCNKEDHNHHDGQVLENSVFVKAEECKFHVSSMAFLR